MSIKGSEAPVLSSSKVRTVLTSCTTISQGTQALEVEVYTAANGFMHFAKGQTLVCLTVVGQPHKVYMSPDLADEVGHALKTAADQIRNLD